MEGGYEVKRGEEEVESDKGLFVRFLMTPQLNAERSKQMGHQVWEDKEAIEITWDNGGSQYVYPLVEKDANGDSDIKSEEFKARFHEQYRAFKAGTSDRQIGIPLEQLFRAEPSKVKHYEYRSIFTVEQLANTNDENIRSCGMGAADDRKDAQRFLAARKDSYAKEQIDLQVNTMKAENDELKEQIATLTARMEKMLARSEREDDEAPVVKKKK